MDAGTLVTVLLSVGGAAFITAVFSGVRSLREGVKAREKEAITNIATWGQDNAKRADKAEDDRDYWRDYAGKMLFQLRKEGIEPVSPPKRNPSDGVES